jgi:hypothetical protein
MTLLPTEIVSISNETVMAAGSHFDVQLCTIALVRFIEYRTQKTDRLVEINTKRPDSIADMFRTQLGRYIYHYSAANVESLCR